MRYYTLRRSRRVFLPGRVPHSSVTARDVDSSDDLGQRARTPRAPSLFALCQGLPHHSLFCSASAVGTSKQPLRSRNSLVCSPSLRSLVMRRWLSVRSACVPTAEGTSRTLPLHLSHGADSTIGSTPIAADPESGRWMEPPTENRGRRLRRLSSMPLPRVSLGSWRPGVACAQKKTTPTLKPPTVTAPPMATRIAGSTWPLRTASTQEVPTPIPIEASPAFDRSPSPP